MLLKMIMLQVDGFAPGFGGARRGVCAALLEGRAIEGPPPYLPAP